MSSGKSWKLAIAALTLGLALAPAAAAAESFTLPEEPDFAFVTGSPYTESKRFLQIILNNQFTQEEVNGTTERLLSNSLRLEYGFTDRLEADLVVNFVNSWLTAPGVESNLNGFGPSLLGVRYRILRESSAPITLTFGPQILPPTANIAKGFGSGGFGLAWDLTTGREWNRWFFHYLAVNYATTFAVLDPTAGSRADFTLHTLNYGLALGFRPVEHMTASGNKHDLHVTMEFDGTLSQEILPGNVTGQRTTENQFFFIPGARYGFLTPKKFLAEVGIAGIVGLTAAAPDWGLILQTQFELGF